MERNCLFFILQIMFLLEGSQCARFIGCYKEKSIQARLMPEWRNFEGSLTPNLCISHCKSKQYSYAGLQYSYQCFCTNERPPFQSSADLSECDAGCAGDKSQKCGGTMRLSVYDIYDKNINYVQKNYLGCYLDAECRSLNKTVGISNMNTPEDCTAFCYRLGYRYAGVEMHDQCFCGDEINGGIAREDDCDRDCSGDNRFRCGGFWRAGVYHTSIPDESEEGRLVGCFIDSPSRILSGYDTKLPKTNTPGRCLSICKQLGFRFAGVQVGVECFCGDRQPDSYKLTNEMDCSQSCPGGNQKKCGGSWRIMIYSTA